MAKLTMEQGDTRRVVGDFTGSAAPFDDLTDATVTLYVMRSTTGVVSTFNGAADAPGADSKSHTCRSAPLDSLAAGSYRATLEVSKAGETEMTTTELWVSPTAKPPAP